MLTSRRTRTLFIGLAAVVLPFALLMGGCGDDDPGGSGPVGGSGAGTGEGICLLNNCSAPEHCLTCTDGRNTCLISEGRCVACDPNLPLGEQGCPPGEECSSWGICVPAGLTCPVDPNTDQPNAPCTANSDCLACSPMHQVCNTAGNPPLCMACTENNTSHCLQSEICIDGHCSPKCPPSCESHNDCAQCGGPGNEAHACYQHKCAQCHPETWPCTEPMVCDNGVCVPPCGIPGPVAGTCLHDEDCANCGPEESWGSYTCKKPVNAEDNDHGTCVPQAAGCADLGPGLVLPQPWSDYTNTCSEDANCQQPVAAGIQYDVGNMIRDLVGGPDISLPGGLSVHICNAAENSGATIFYAMEKCASIEIVGDAECGLCVPCKEDSDCPSIGVDPLLPGLFCDDPIVMIAGAMLIDLLWGDSEDHSLHFWCQPIAAGYGVCIPCANPTQSCGSSSGGGSGNCDHPTDEVGTALDPSCNDCAAMVCAADSFCCDGVNGSWDQVCVDSAAQMCSGCAHDPCTEGDALAPACSPCVTAVCNTDPYCCNAQGGAWDSVCVDLATAEPACSGACSGGCNGDPCETSAAPETDGCSPCVTAVCAADDYCCTVEWDDLCVTEAEGQGDCPC